MSEPPDTPEPDGPAAGEPGARTEPPRRSWLSRLFSLRRPLPRWQALVVGLLFLLLLWGLWSFATAGAPEDRLIARSVLPSPGETFESFHELWFERALTRNTFTTLRRVILGFLLACLVGIPLGVLCGCFGPVQAFFHPLTIFGRNIPLAALIPLTFAFFGIGEAQKVMFIFIACVPFVFGDAVRSVLDVPSQYVETARTLGASRWQTVYKVLLPLSAASIYNGLRILFGLAFGYIMLAEVVNAEKGLGQLIMLSQRRGPVAHVYLILITIGLIAYGIDRLLWFFQKGLFPYRVQEN